MSKSHKLICKVADSLIERFESDDIKGCSKTLDLVEDNSISITVSVHNAKDNNPTLSLKKAEQRIEDLEKCIEFMINQSEPFREEFADIDESVELAISLIEPCSGE